MKVVFWRLKWFADFWHSVKSLISHILLEPRTSFFQITTAEYFHFILCTNVWLHFKKGKISKTVSLKHNVSKFRIPGQTDQIVGFLADSRGDPAAVFLHHVGSLVPLDAVQHS